MKLRPYRQRMIAHRRNEKLGPKYNNPYEIVELIGEVAYRLKLSSTATHVSQLRRGIGDHATSSELLGTLTVDLEVMLEPQELKGIRQGEGGLKEVLIKWKNLPDHDTTWEPYERVKHRFPPFYLEDNVAL